MNNQQLARSPSRRRPLGEATRRVNNAQQPQAKSPPSKIIQMPHHESRRIGGLLHPRTVPLGAPLSPNDCDPSQNVKRDASLASNAANPRLSAIFKEYTGTDSNRNSQISTASTNASDGKRIKQYIGPWKLGKTLGKGATARVRRARHASTGQEAAIKIVQKQNAVISQAGSLANLDKAVACMSDTGDGLRRMPVGIEREVAIMKLIQHPNILRLYDIWENRTEIYLVLEYVDNGELFEHITANGRLEEEVAIRYFRQILSAVGYCHSFNICHRDLKPENILLTKAGEIKIADFGMAALHQSPDHKLKTSCGSPHYAAPELIRGETYRGDKVDIWSLGVILYATLAGRLPFDVEGSGRSWLAPLLAKIRKGAYEMAPEFSEDAANLIWRILQVNPRDRINLNQIWRHPLLRKYDYLDSLGGASYPQSPDMRHCGRPVLHRSDINEELLRHLLSMWHGLSEQQLIEKLLSEQPNDQKLFYSLLLKYGDAQLENYTPDLGHSPSDYHHVKPFGLTKTYSTCHFAQPRTKNHGRQVSRFTVISNAAETEKSYDPFKASRPQHLDAIRPIDRTTITVHRTVNETATEDQLSSKTKIVSRASIAASSERGRQRKLNPPKPYTSRSSLASSTRSRNSAPYVRATIGHRRGVSFSHLRKLSPAVSTCRVGHTAIPQNQASGRHSNHTEVTDDGGDSLRNIGDMSAAARYIRSRKADSTAQNLSPTIPAKTNRASQIWTEDVRVVSSSLARDCDEAFNRSSVMIASESATGAIVASSNTNRKLKRAALDIRPLPAPPSQTNSVKIELLEARKQAELRKTSGENVPSDYIDRMVSHIDRLIQPSPTSKMNSDRRTTSAPVDQEYIVPGQFLPSIYEGGREDMPPRRPFNHVDDATFEKRAQSKNSRTTSAPEPRLSYRTYRNDRFSRPGTERDTIRVVVPSSPGSPVKAPAPLIIRKKPSKTTEELPLMSGGLACGESSHLPRVYPQQKSCKKKDSALAGTYNSTVAGHEHGPGSGPSIRKTSNWFRRNSKSSEEFKGLQIQPSSNYSIPPPHLKILFSSAPPPPKSRTFYLRKFFKKRDSKPDMVVAPNDVFDEASSVQDSTVDVRCHSHLSRYANIEEDPRARQIEPRQNWLAKLFHVKPACKFICFSIRRNKARNEITGLLREWKQYGIRDVQVDKERNIVFGKVAQKNYLDLREVTFAGEIMTVIEHGKKSHLSIARFTQEKGAASSFHRVVETLENVLRCRGFLVMDERKKRMMIKTLNSA